MTLIITQISKSFDVRNRERVCLLGGDNEGHPSHIG